MKTFEILHYKVLLGENAEDNESLLARSRPKDLWFHLSDFPSAHCILVYNEDPPDDDVVLFCAGLVKRHSKHKAAPRVAVDMIERQYIVRDRGKTGSVIMLQKPRRLIV